MRETDGPYLPAPEEERDLLIGAAKEAGDAVLPFFREAGLKVWAKEDNSPVTEADIRANDVLREALLTGLRSSYGWLSEESAADLGRTDKARTIIVDPIDGTRAFLRGEDAFTTCLAIIENGAAIASVIYAPARGELYAAAKGSGTTLNGAPIAASQRAALAGSRLIGTKAMYGHPGWPKPWPDLAVDYINSTSYRLALVASGAAHGTLALTAKADWDSAPGTLIAAEAGAEVSDHLGNALTFGTREASQPSIICTAPNLYGDVLSRLAHLPADLSTLKV